MNKITKKKLIETIELINALGGDLRLCPRNGYYAIENGRGSRVHTSGGARELYYYLRGVLACYYLDITFDHNK